MTKTNKKQKNLATPTELQESLIDSLGEAKANIPYEDGGIFQYDSKVKIVQISNPYKLGDFIEYGNKYLKVVEVKGDMLHVKNQQSPFDSFLIGHGALNTAFDKAVENFGTEELAKAIVQDIVFLDAPSVGLEVIEDYNAPDLMVREDKSISL